MSDQEHLEMMLKQYNSTKNSRTKRQLEKGIYRLRKKMREAKLGMSGKDNVYVAR